MEKTYSDRIQEMLLLLASQADIQIKSFPRYVHIPDEIAMETSDVIEFAPKENNMIDAHILSTFKKIDLIFGNLEEGCWTLDGLMNSPAWENIRFIAQTEIDFLQLIYREPDLYWINYVPVSDDQQ